MPWSRYTIPIIPDDDEISNQCSIFECIKLMANKKVLAQKIFMPGIEPRTSKVSRQHLMFHCDGFCIRTKAWRLLLNSLNFKLYSIYSYSLESNQVLSAWEQPILELFLFQLYKTFSLKIQIKVLSLNNFEFSVLMTSLRCS